MITIGRRDFINLPQFELTNIVAKVDTGAYGCSLHCHKIEVENVNGEKILKFKLLDPQHPEYEDKYYYTTNFTDKQVKNSGGQVEHRYAIKTKVHIFHKTYIVEFSLANRKKMKYPILIGRKFLSKKFIVDVSRKNLSLEVKNK